MSAYLASSTLYQALQSRRFVIAGPCVLESYDLALQVAHAVKKAAKEAGLLAVFKSSFDKANRTSGTGFRGPGMMLGLEWLASIRKETGLPVTTDIHDPSEAEPVAAVADILQIPALLCRQTPLLLAAALTGKVVNVKKGQFMSPWDMDNVVKKIKITGNNPHVMLTERGTTFGYNNLVVDMRSIPVMSGFDVPVVMDATHSVQLPGGQGGCSGGDRTMVPYLARAAAAAGCHGVFLECHPNPDEALCDGPNSLRLSDLPGLLQKLCAIWRVSHGE